MRAYINIKIIRINIFQSLNLPAILIILLIRFFNLVALELENILSIQENLKFRDHNILDTKVISKTIIVIKLIN
jgi:hypothetical protein